VLTTDCEPQKKKLCIPTRRGPFIARTLLLRGIIDAQSMAEKPEAYDTKPTQAVSRCAWEKQNMST
jgi:hypothetical protein